MKTNETDTSVLDCGAAVREAISRSATGIPPSARILGRGEVVRIEVGGRHRRIVRGAWPRDVARIVLAVMREEGRVQKLPEAYRKYR